MTECLERATKVTIQKLIRLPVVEFTAMTNYNLTEAESKY